MKPGIFQAARMVGNTMSQHQRLLWHRVLYYLRYGNDHRPPDVDSFCLEWWVFRQAAKFQVHLSSLPPGGGSVQSAQRQAFRSTVADGGARRVGLEIPSSAGWRHVAANQRNL
ncbi:hypothetical protein AVEN_188638-1 [Araneus ventricosus]|uniref:Uncharacterized protein n=1 Tax=Araneus ventricosus TaxID=182803 RepID=A0A4Y2W9E8_ARAVE|nr:hypothetical protein AVEN_188638-1 [Araneus ventricosus]